MNGVWLSHRFRLKQQHLNSTESLSLAPHLFYRHIYLFNVDLNGIPYKCTSRMHSLTWSGWHHSGSASVAASLHRSAGQQPGQRGPLQASPLWTADWTRKQTHISHPGLILCCFFMLHYHIMQVLVYTHTKWTKTVSAVFVPVRTLDCKLSEWSWSNVYVGPNPVKPVLIITDHIVYNVYTQYDMT